MASAELYFCSDSRRAITESSGVQDAPSLRKQLQRTHFFFFFFPRKLFSRDFTLTASIHGSAKARSIFALIPTKHVEKQCLYCSSCESGVKAHLGWRSPTAFSTARNRAVLKGFRWSVIRRSGFHSWSWEIDLNNHTFFFALSDFNSL